MLAIEMTSSGLFWQVMDCTMPVIGEHQAEDRQTIADLVVIKMNQALSKTPIPSPQRTTATTQPQVFRFQYKVI